MTGSFYNAMHTCPIKLNGGNNQARVSLMCYIPRHECQETFHLVRVATTSYSGRYEAQRFTLPFCALDTLNLHWK